MITREDIISLGWIERTDPFYIEKVLPRENYRSFSKDGCNLEWWPKLREDRMNVCTSMGTLPLLIFDSEWHNITTVEELQKLTAKYNKHWKK